MLALERLRKRFNPKESPKTRAERAALQEILASSSVWVTRRNFANPEYTLIQGDPSANSCLAIGRVLNLLDLSDQVPIIFKKHEGVYRFFTDSGLQILANVLQKEVNYAEAVPGYGYDTFFDPDTVETFHPDPLFPRLLRS